jgi:glyoxylase-like metal-dependent hydrolase (beta-lactamase superfamily II)
MRTHRISLPTPFKVGVVNVYLIQEEPLTLIDTGPQMREALEALREGLARLGHRVADIRRVIISHAHADHFGLARTIVEESGAEVYIHRWDAPSVLQTTDHSQQLKRAGTPKETVEQLRKIYAEVKQYSPHLDRVEILEDEDEIPFERGSLRVIHTPGHTPGSICLFREGNRSLFSADTVIKHITPNPVLNPDPIDPRRRFQSLGEYLVSLARIKALAPTLVQSGHGQDLTDYDEYFYRLYRFTESRQAELIRMVPRHGATAWEMCNLLFPKAEGQGRFLALSETIAHLDYAAAEGKLKLEPGEEVDIYRPAAK